MAPLRSSRSTRNQDHQAASRSRGIVDLDPTEGLPVQKWEQICIKVNQDPSADLASLSNNGFGPSATSSAEWSAQFNTAQFPWSESPLPSFFTQLPPWNQEMLRRARIGNTKPTLSEWDRKAQAWVSAADLEKKQNSTKVELAKSTEPVVNANVNGVDEAAEHDGDEENDDQAEDDMEVDNEDEHGGQGRNLPSAKRRKQLAPEERTFEVKRWTQVPLAVAEKTEERKFLADRRPGMPSLYGGPYQNQVFQPLGLSQGGYTAFGTSNASYDLGDGGGLGTAVTQEQNAAPQAVRRNIPPKRKKKKGGPGRRKAPANTAGEAGATSQSATGADPADGSALGLTSSDAAIGQAQDQDVSMQDGEEEGSESGDSEGEGSEEGEVDGGDNQRITQESEAQKDSLFQPTMQTQHPIELPIAEETLQPSLKVSEIPEDVIPQSTLMQLDPEPTSGSNASADPVPIEIETFKEEADVTVDEGSALEPVEISASQPQPEIISMTTDSNAAQSPKPTVADVMIDSAIISIHEQPIDESTVAPIAAIIDQDPETTDEKEVTTPLSEAEKEPQPPTAISVTDPVTQTPTARASVLEPDLALVEPVVPLAQVEIPVQGTTTVLHTLSPIPDPLRPVPASQVPTTSTAMESQSVLESGPQDIETTTSPPKASINEPDLLGGLEEQLNKDMEG